MRAGLRRAVDGVRWYLAEVSGERGYDRYLEHHARCHPGEEPLSRRAFERHRVDRRDHAPGARCC